MAKEKDDGRSRSWCFIGYPGDSLPINYAEILSDELHLCWAESPVHDADLNSDGEEKKKHIHFYLAFEGNKSFNQIKAITDLLNCPIPQICRNPRSYVRYFIHLDNPEKWQYKQSEIKCHGGICVDEYFTKNYSEKRSILKDIIQFCMDNNIYSYAELAEIVLSMDDDDWFDAVTRSNSIFLSQYLRSRRSFK